MTTRMQWVAHTAVACVAAVRHGVRWVSGDLEYARYRAECTRTGVRPADRGQYFARQLERRYTTASRCC